MTNIFRAEGLGKTYPGVRANDDISFSVEAGEIHALLGENGAGKSTLVKMIYGLVRPDDGHMTLMGAAHAPADPRAARAAGVAMVFQHFSLFDALSVAENIALGMENPPARAELARRIAELSRSYGLPLDPARRVATLSAGERQRVEILRCLLQNPRLLIMDEPTSVLTPQEAEILFATLRQLAAAGTAILYISHKLDEIRGHCDRATILRHGKVVGTCIPRDETAASIARMMVGADIHQIRPARARPVSAEPLLSVSGLSVEARDIFGTPLKDVSLDIYPGEIVGIAGIAGNGQSELFDAISGERLSDRPEQVKLFGRNVGHDGISARRSMGAVFISEERLGHATVPSLPLSENVILTRYRVNSGLRSGFFLNRGRARILLDSITSRLDVRKSASDPAAQALSGGNLQKFIIGREVLEDPKVIVVNQPTWGVDAGSAARIRQTLVDLAAGGAAILVISQDLDELFEFTDRLAAMAGGRLSAFEPVAETNRNAIGLKMSGIFEGEPA